MDPARRERPAGNRERKVSGLAGAADFRPRRPQGHQQLLHGPLAQPPGSRQQEPAGDSGAESGQESGGSPGLSGIQCDLASGGDSQGSADEEAVAGLSNRCAHRRQAARESPRVIGIERPDDYDRRRAKRREDERAVCGALGGRGDDRAAHFSSRRDRDVVHHGAGARCAVRGVRLGPARTPHTADGIPFIYSATSAVLPSSATSIHFLSSTKAGRISTRPESTSSRHDLWKWPSSSTS